VPEPANYRVRGAQVSLLEKDGKIAHSQSANAEGETEWIGLPIGTNRFRISSSGFIAQQISAIIANTEVKVEVSGAPLVEILVAHS
jgi:hypothetical protein